MQTPEHRKTQSFSDVISHSITGITEGLGKLAIECERLADEREAHTLQECHILRSENRVLKQRLGEADEASVPLVSENHMVRVDSRDSNINSKHQPKGVKKSNWKDSAVFEPWPEFLRYSIVGNLELHEDYWQSDNARPDHDHGFCDTGSTHHLEDEPSHGIVVDPASHLKLSWDLLGIPVLAWDLITIPMGVFDIGETTLMVTMSWVTMVYWTIDMPVTFVTGYYDADGNQVMDLQKIVWQYLRGFFFLDLLIVSSDWVGVLIEFLGSGEAGGLKNMGALRILRVSRFMRLMRLRKLKAKWQTIEDNIDSEWSLVCLNLLGKVLSIMALNHYVGCLFYWLGKQDMPGYATWLSYPYPQLEPTTKMELAPWGYLYITSVHWAITQFTPGSMHIQAQNIVERVFSIFCLLFGLVVFSSFLASVTQARMQLNKMMSKFERDLWILRKYCRQNQISSSLTIRMKRYVDFVLVPRYQKMSQQDVVLLPQLSQHLRDELMTELVSKYLELHPFFKELTSNKSVLTDLCIAAVRVGTYARGDVIFNAGQVGGCMYVVAEGILEYLPLKGKDDDAPTPDFIVICTKGKVISEAVLWTPWTQQGQLQAAIETESILVDSAKFRRMIVGNAFAMNVARRYAYEYLKAMNEDVDRTGIPSDVQSNTLPNNSMKNLRESLRNGEHGSKLFPFQQSPSLHSIESDGVEWTRTEQETTL